MDHDDATPKVSWLDPIVEEIHRHRESLLCQCGNDPEALVGHLQARERESGRPVLRPPVRVRPEKK